MSRPVTVITGASSGLGSEFARQCGRRGDELVLVARRRDRLEQLADEIGGRAHVIAADLAFPDAPQKLLREIDRLGLTVDILINNAGFGLAGPFVDQPAERQLELIDLNIRSLTLLARLVLPDMLARGRGGILNVASTGAFQAGPGFAVYFASKAYVLSFTEALHQECRRTGVRISALCPGPTRTEFGSVAGVTSERFDRLSADPGTMVSAGLAGPSANKAVVIPGISNKIGAQSNRFIPRFIMRRIVASLKL
jgi:uncharacterized protein